jgi:hypothetical protein
MIAPAGKLSELARIWCEVSFYEGGGAPLVIG